MPYMLLIVESPDQREARTEAQGRAAYESMTQYAKGLKQQGVLLGADALSSLDGSTARVAVRGGQAHVMDGPFAEAKELIGGYFIVDCATREQAVALARDCPAAAWATVEVRRIATCYE